MGERQGERALAAVVRDVRRRLFFAALAAVRPPTPPWLCLPSCSDRYPPFSDRYPSCSDRYTPFSDRYPSFSDPCVYRTPLRIALWLRARGL